MVGWSNALAPCDGWNWTNPLISRSGASILRLYTNGSLEPPGTSMGREDCEATEWNLFGSLERGGEGQAALLQIAHSWRQAGALDENSIAS